MDLTQNDAERERNRRLHGTPWTPATSLPPPPKEWHKVPNSARLYNWLTDGDDHFQSEAQVFAHLDAPGVRLAKDAARVNPAHTSLIARALALQGVTQFLDLGCGYPQVPRRPHVPAVHEAVLDVHPGATMIYVDIDTSAIAHRRVSTETIGVGFVQGDLRAMDTLLASAQISSRLDLTRPVGLLMHDVLPWIADTEAGEALRVLRAWAPPGSRLSLTHAADMAPSMPSKLTPILREVADRCPAADLTYTTRDKDAIAQFFGDWTLLSPGIVPTNKWHHDHPWHSYDPHRAGAYAGVGVKGGTA